MIHVRDARGVEIELVQPPSRVVSLVPSITETLFALGVGPSVAAVTDWCIFPPGLTLPKVGGTKNPDIEVIRALQPDLVHMNLEENMKRHADAIAEFAPLFASEPKTVDDVDALLVDLAAIHGCTADAERLRNAIATARDAIRKRAFTFAVPIWKDPWMWCAGDTYVSSLVEEAGGANLLANERRYPTLSLEDVAAMSPDVIFLPDEPYLFTEEDARVIAAAIGARVIGPFPGHLFTWHGARTLDGLRFLADVLKSA